jgi:hypothetical protein
LLSEQACCGQWRAQQRKATTIAGISLLIEATMTEIPEEKKERVPESEMAM